MGRNNWYKKKKKGDDTMSALAKNYAYVVKAKKNEKGGSKEAVVSDERMRSCKAVADKYPLKK